jgi:hypothetical protein
LRRWLTVADLYTSPVKTIDIQKKMRHFGDTLKYCSQEESNEIMQPGGENARAEYAVWYVNVSRHYYHHESSGKNAITKARI